MTKKISKVNTDQLERKKKVKTPYQKENAVFESLSFLKKRKVKFTFASA